tara:strand:+ start:640 stop:2487 length:1848 start_codon:yes stop_codon:yes gene_type:complete
MAGETKNRDIDLTGLLKTYITCGFTLLQCILENLDNCLDNKATEIRITIEKINDSWKIIFSSNGKGMTREQLDKAQIMAQHSEEDLDTKHGRFGMGYPVSRSMLTGNKGKVLWLSCHTPLTEEETGDKFYSGKFSQCVIDMDRTMALGYINKELSNEIERKNENIWNNYAADTNNTGVVLMYDITENTATELRNMVRHSVCSKNLSFNIMQTYPCNLNENVTIKINEQIVESLPKLEDFELCEKRKIEIYNATIEDKTYPDSAEIKPPFVFKDCQTGIIKTTYRCKNGRHYIKELKDGEYKLGELEYSRTTTYVDNKKMLLNYYKEILNRIGINIDSQQQELYNEIFSSFLKRGNKLIKISQDKTKDNGDKNKINCWKDTISIIEPNKITTKSDAELGVTHNKSDCRRENISPEIACILYGIKHLHLKMCFYNSWIKPQEEKELDDEINKINQQVIQQKEVAEQKEEPDRVFEADTYRELFYIVSSYDDPSAVESVTSVDSIESTESACEKKVRVSPSVIKEHDRTGHWRSLPGTGKTNSPKYQPPLTQGESKSPDKQFSIEHFNGVNSFDILDSIIDHAKSGDTLASQIINEMLQNYIKDHPENLKQIKKFECH